MDIRFHLRFYVIISNKISYGFLSLIFGGTPDNAFIDTGLILWKNNYDIASFYPNIEKNRNLTKERIIIPQRFFPQREHDPQHRDARGLQRHRHRSSCSRWKPTADSNRPSTPPCGDGAEAVPTIRRMRVAAHSASRSSREV